MKKNLIISLLFILSINLAAQTKQEVLEVIKKEAVLMNKQLPQKVAFVSIQKVEIKNNNYIVYSKIDENQQDLDKYVDNMNKHKSNVFSLITGKRQDSVNLFIKSGLNIIFDVTGNISKRRKQIVISSAEIKKSLENNYSSIDYIKTCIDEVRKTLPEDWGDGLTCTDIKINGQYVCYQIKTDDSYITIPLLKEIKADGTGMENEIIEDLNSTNDDQTLFFIKHIKLSNMGVKYVYWSDKSNETVEFLISPYTFKTRIKDRSKF